jgi:hypothetical protein
LVIIGTGDNDKASAGLMYTRNVLKHKWLDDVKVVFFGPSEQLVAHDDKIRGEAEDVAAMTDCFACKAISDDKEVSEKLAEMGIRIEYVGTVVSNLIKEGYVPMVW